MVQLGLGILVGVPDSTYLICSMSITYLGVFVWVGLAGFSSLTLTHAHSFFFKRIFFSP